MVADPTPTQGGAPRDVYASRDYVIVHMDAVRTLGSWEAAGCFQRIAWRCEREGLWRASMQQIADEIGVSERSAKRITKTLRDLGWITAERSAAYDATLTWRIVWADQPESAKLAPSEGPGGAAERAKLSPSEKAKLALSSSETTETVETIGADESAQPEAIELTDEERRTGRDADGQPLRGKRLDLLTNEVTKAWWDWAKTEGILPTQSFIACRGVVKTALANEIANGRTPDSVKHALARLAREHRPVSGGAMQIALGLVEGQGSQGRQPYHPSVDAEYRERVGGYF